MSDFLTDFLASILNEQGCPDPRRVAARAADDLRKSGMVDQSGVKKAAIQSDPCRDYKVVSRSHGVSVSFVYRAWNQSKYSPH